MVIVPTVNGKFPLFKIVKVLVPLLEPKSVQSATDGVKSPSAIEVVFP